MVFINLKSSWAGALGSWLARLPFTPEFGARFPVSVETKMFLPHPRVKVSIVGSLRDREVACWVSDRQGSNFESCVWRTVSSQSSHHPQEVLLAQFILCAQRWPKARFISFEIIINVLVSSSRFIRIHMLWSTTIVNVSISAGTVFRRQNLTSIDIRFIFN